MKVNKSGSKLKGPERLKGLSETVGRLRTVKVRENISLTVVNGSNLDRGSDPRTNWVYTWPRPQRHKPNDPHWEYRTDKAENLAREELQNFLNDLKKDMLRNW
jgi:hypothetical protein